MSAVILVDGIAQSSIDVRDRAVQYGDGLFETMAVIDGRVRRLEAHLARLESGCERLGIPVPGRPLLEAEIAAVVTGRDRAVLKLIVTRGFGARGYRPAAQAVPTRVLWLDAWPEYPSAWAQDGVKVRMCRTRLGDQPLLAGIKHLNRLEQILARREWNDPAEDGIAEGLMMDARDAVVCGTMSNVFVVQNGRLLTPPLDRSGVAGTVRQAVMQAAGGLGLEVDETALEEAALYGAEEIFLTNALIGLWPVRAVDARTFAVGAVTRRLLELFR